MILKENNEPETTLVKNPKSCYDDHHNIEERIYILRSLEVSWEGQHSFMHVFIDTTDIVRLEEAKNNI